MITAFPNLQTGRILEDGAISKSWVDLYVGRDKRHCRLHSVDLESVTHENKEPTCSHFTGTLGEILLPSQFAVVMRGGESHAPADK